MEENVKKYVVLKKLIQHLRIFHITLNFFSAQKKQDVIDHALTGCQTFSCQDSKTRRSYFHY